MADDTIIPPPAPPPEQNPGAAAPPGTPQRIDSGLLSLVLVARFHQVPVTPEE